MQAPLLPKCIPPSSTIALQTLRKVSQKWLQLSPTPMLASSAQIAFASPVAGASLTGASVVAGASPVGASTLGASPPSVEPEPPVPAPPSVVEPAVPPSSALEPAD